MNNLSELELYFDKILTQHQLRSQFVLSRLTASFAPPTPTLPAYPTGAGGGGGAGRRAKIQGKF